MKRPKWAQAKVRFYFATCYYAIADGVVHIEGVHFYDDFLISLSTYWHNYFIAPFLSDNQGFPFRYVELYE